MTARRAFLYLTPLLLSSHTNGSLFPSSLTATAAHGEKREARSRKNLFMGEEEEERLNLENYAMLAVRNINMTGMDLWCTT